MAYNLNYNQGVEYDNQQKHRKVLIILVSLLVLLVLAIVIYLGFRNKNNQSAVDNSSAEMQALIQSMTAKEGNTPIINEASSTKLIQGMTAKSGPGGSPKEVISGSQKEELMKSMRAN